MHSRATASTPLSSTSSPNAPLRWRGGAWGWHGFLDQLDAHLDEAFSSGRFAGLSDEAQRNLYEHELKTINPMFSMKDIIKMMGPNTASYIQMSDQLGTLETGKLADLILLDGNPLDGYWNMLKTQLVVKGGVIVVDKH